MKHIKNKADFFVGLGIIAFIVVIWTQTFELADTVRMLPLIVMAIGILMGLGILIMSFFRAGNQEKKPKSNSVNMTVIGIILLAFNVVMMMITEVIGMYTCLFLIITSISLTITCVRYGFAWKEVLSAILYDVVVIVIIFLLFNTFLGLSTPTGVLI